MTDQSTPIAEITPPAASNRGWKTPVLVAGAFVLGLSGAFMTTAFSQGRPFGPGFADGGPMGAMRAAIEPLMVNTMIDHGIRHLAIEIDASADQQAKLIAIAQGAAKDLLPVREQVEAARERGRALLVQPNLDRAAIEAFRADEIALADQVSKRVAQAVGDMSEVLSPAQRTKIMALADAARANGGPRGGGLPGPGGFGPPWHRG